MVALHFHRNSRHEESANAEQASTSHQGAFEKACSDTRAIINKISNRHVSCPIERRRQVEIKLTPPVKYW